MGLNKVEPGSNMYDWITHTHNHLAGACPHACNYCSTKDLARRFSVMRERYSGPVRLIEKELAVNYGSGKTIFLENCGDLFAEGIPGFWIIDILEHVNKYPTNTYVFQTKNPFRLWMYFYLFPPNFLIGTTAESNFAEPSRSQAPPAHERLRAMKLLSSHLHCPTERKFVTIEPVLWFSVQDFLPMLLDANVGAYHIGADSKKHGLPEPTGMEIAALVEGLREAGKKVVLKSNLKRLYWEGGQCQTTQ